MIKYKTKSLRPQTVKPMGLLTIILMFQFLFFVNINISYNIIDKEIIDQNEIINDQNLFDTNLKILHFEIETKIPEILVDTAPNGEKCAKLEFNEDMNYLCNSGSPRLPFQTLKILLPYGFDLNNVEIELGKSTPIALNYKIEAAQEPIPIGSNLLPEYNFNSLIYDSSELFPGMYYSVEGIYRLRGYNILILNLYPVQYFPKAEKISLIENMKVMINLQSIASIDENDVALLRNNVKDRERIISFVDNPEQMASYQEAKPPVPLLPSRSYDYVIITNDALKNSAGAYTFQDLVDYKNSLGISTTIITTEEIYANYTGIDNQEKIRNFIIDAYTDWGIEYVLLGGDGDGADVGGESGDDIIPVRGFYDPDGYGDDNIPSDLYYAALDGTWNDDSDSYWGEDGEEDFIAEIFIGRAPVDSEIELSNFVYKTIAHDMSSNSYLSEAYMVGEDLGWVPWGGDYKDEIRNGSSNYGHTTVGFPAEYTVSTLYDRDLDPNRWSSTDLIPIINNGVHIINHLGHAYNGEVMKMTIAEVETNLTNNNYFFAYSQGCYAGAFDNRGTGSSYYDYDAVVEHFVTSDHGAFAFIANTRYGWGDGYGTDGPSQHYDREFFDAIFNENIVEIGKANQDSKEDCIGFISNELMKWCYYQITLFGDPTANILSQPNDNAPVLSSESLTPKSGYQDTPLTFTVTYTDSDNNNPSYVRVDINGIKYNMEKKNPLDDDFTDGCVYQLITYLQSDAGNYSYFFECRDSKFYNSTSKYNDLQISYSNYNTPMISDASVDPLTGYINSTFFTYAINYSDIDNNAPQMINVLIDSIPHSMIKLDNSDNLYIDGCIYVFSTQLNDLRTHSFSFECSDGSGSIFDGPYSGPLVEIGPSIAILDANTEPSYFVGGWNNDYNTLYTGLISNGLDVGIITNDEIKSGGLYSKDVVILIDNTPDDEASVFLKNWSLNGGNLLTFDSSICFLNWAGILPPEAEGSNGFQLYWEYNSPSTGIVVNESHPVMNGYKNGENIYGTSFDSQYYSNIISSSSIGKYYTPLVKDSVGSNYDLVVALEAPRSGRVVHIWDQYHWAQGSNHQLILNAIDWISIPNSYSPQLVNASVSPKIGYQNTEFNFRVAYLDLDNNAPRDINAIINGTAYPMSKIDPLDNNYIDGCIYEISTFLIPLTTTNYSYYFECSDGKYSNSTFIYNDIEVFETNYAPPKLLNPQVSPLIGGNNTIFTFLIDYYDDDNNQPHNINISIDGMEFLMEKVDISDNNAMDGIQYYYQTTLDYGFYNFMMQCYDGFYSNSTEWIDAPEVNPFYDIGGGIIFKDDFEDGSFDTDWTVTGFGLGGVDMATSNSGVYSAYHSSDIGSITLKTIDLSSYRNVNLSYWIRRGSDEFSEEPDLGEDFYVEYYSNTGTWEQIAIYPGDGIPGEIFHQISFILPTNALHSEFSLRFRQETGSGAGFDYWHFDDVMLTADQSLVLLSPINGAILFNGMNTFQWRGFNDIIPNVNYTIQLSNSSDFSLLNYEIVDIQGTDIMTNVSIDLQLSNGQYFWRVRPTYEIFSGNWTNFNAFTFMQNDYIPNLTNFSVFPYIGTHRTIFNFSVLYQDKDDNPPFSISVVINGIINQMQKIEINDDNYTDGCWYQLITTLQPNTFNYTYYFECTDGKFLDNSTSFNDIFVYNNAPLLIGGTVDPKIGYGSNTYTFKVLYLDIDNDFPEYVFVIINGVYGNMSKIDFSDNNYIDGCLYQYQTRLYANSVNYTYSFICSDGFNYTSTAVNNDLKVEENPTDPIVEGLPFIIGGSVIGLIGLGLTIGLIKVKKSQKHYQMGSLEKERLTDSLKSSNNTYDEYFRKKQIVSGQRACSNCGKISPLESRYCVYCGKIIESQSNIRASADSMKNGGAMGFPGHYGCPHCNKMIPNNSIFCIYCGKPVR